MSTPARRHKQRALAAQSADTGPAASAASDQYQLMQHALWQARQRLKRIKSVESKVAAKRDEILPEFTTYVAGVLEADAGGQDDVIANIMVWAFDVGQLDYALAIAAYIIRHGIEAPDQYQRDAPAIIAEQTADEVLQRIDPDGDDQQATATLAHNADTAHTLTAGADIHDPIRAKLEKARGTARRALGEDDAALEHLERARELNEHAGVKKAIEQLTRRINKSDGDRD
ncbi:terminase [Salinisphaera sp. USBA-960]|nr:terminase [Salifodinibacter halophilus]NNC25314.1 terminase [Salifodinibacter halophilus]